MTSHSPASSPELPKLPKPLIARGDFPAFQAKIAMNCYSAVQMDHRWREGCEAGSAAAAQAAKQVPAEWLFVQMDDEGQAYLTWCTDRAAIERAVEAAIYCEPLSVMNTVDREDLQRVVEITDSLIEDGFFDFGGDPGLKLFRIAGNGLPAAPTGEQA